MGKHNAPRTRISFWTLLGAGTAAVALITGTLLTQDWTSDGIAGAAHAVAEDSASWDCRTMGNHICGTRQAGVWVEYGVDGLDGGHAAEVIYGPLDARPRDNTADIGETFFYADDPRCGWVAMPVTVGTAADGFTIDPAGCN